MSRPKRIRVKSFKVLPDRITMTIVKTGAFGQDEDETIVHTNGGKNIYSPTTVNMSYPEIESMLNAMIAEAQVLGPC
jgi:hypothetical protein